MELKYLDLFKCYWILLILQSYPLGVGVGGWGWGCVCEGVSHTCMHVHTHTHMHTHTHTNMHVKHDKHGCLHVGGHLQFLYMYTCVCIHVHACLCMCTCVGTPPCLQTPTHPPTCPLPTSCREPKIPKFNLRLQLIKIFWFCLKILYLWTLLNSYRL